MKTLQAIIPYTAVDCSTGNEFNRPSAVEYDFFNYIGVSGWYFNKADLKTTR